MGKRLSWAYIGEPPASYALYAMFIVTLAAAAVAYRMDNVLASALLLAVWYIVAVVYLIAAWKRGGLVKSDDPGASRLARINPRMLAVLVMLGYAVPFFALSVLVFGEPPERATVTAVVAAGIFTAIMLRRKQSR